MSEEFSNATLRIENGKMLVRVADEDLPPLDPGMLEKQYLVAVSHDGLYVAFTSGMGWLFVASFDGKGWKQELAPYVKSMKCLAWKANIGSAPDLIVTDINGGTHCIFQWIDGWTLVGKKRRRR